MDKKLNRKVESMLSNSKETSSEDATLKSIRFAESI